MFEDKFGEKVTDPADPDRCQSNIKHGQCPYKVLEGTDSCARHGGILKLKRTDKRAAQMYNLMLWRAKLDALKQSPEAKTLGDEVAILRMTLEATLEKCKTTEDLFMMSSTIGDLATKVEKVLRSAHAMDQASGNLMDKTKAIAFAGTVVEIVNVVLATSLPDVELRERMIDQISQKILESLQSPVTDE